MGGVRLKGDMNTEGFYIRADRRRVLRALMLGAGGLWVPGVLAEALTLTPRSTEGPYYPDHLPLDQDNDLVRCGGEAAAAMGTVAGFGGRVLNADGKAIEGATVELWQADNNGCYIHSQGVQRGRDRDPLFQGFGKMETNQKGEYRFRTILPALYAGRTRHFHVAVVKGGKRLLTTQLFIAGEPQNERDGILKRMGTDEQRLSVIRPFEKVSGEEGALVATWDIVLGNTAAEPVGRKGRPAAR
jgi:protocatechuate 3,4-dioxygenase beta subunit